MSCVKLPGARGPEALARVVKIPDVEVADLWAFGRGNAAEVACGNFPGAAGADGEDE